MALLHDGACKGRDTAVTRSQQKYHFHKRYRTEEIMDLYKARFFALFDNACFKCGQIARLDIDHHVPFSRGGRYEEGNLVALCQECNGDKKERTPASVAIRSTTWLQRRELSLRADTFKGARRAQRWELRSSSF